MSTVGVVRMCLQLVWAIILLGRSDVQRVLCRSGAGCDAVFARRTALSVLPSAKVSLQFPEPDL